MKKFVPGSEESQFADGLVSAVSSTNWSPTSQLLLAPQQILSYIVYMYVFCTF